MNAQTLQEAVQTYSTWTRTNPELYREDKEEQAERKTYFQSWTAERIAAIDEEGLLELLSRLWALKSPGNKQYVIEKLRQNLAGLLHGSGSVDVRWDRFTTSVNGMGPAMMSELLCHIHPNEYMIWNSKAHQAFQNPGMTNLPRYNYQMTGRRYATFCDTAKQIAEQMQATGLPDVDLLEVNYFLWGHLQGSPRAIAAEQTRRISHATEPGDIAQADEHDFIYKELRDKLRDIGQ